MEKKNYVRSIFDRFVKGKNSSAELDRLFRYFNESPEHGMRQMIAEELENPVDESGITSSEEQALKRVDRRVYAHLSGYASAQADRLVLRKKRQSIYRWLSAAAILLVCTCGAYYLYMHHANIFDSRLTTDIQHDVDPGGNRATLTLADGRTLTLSEDKVSIVIGSDAVSYGDGNVIAGLSDHSAEALNTIQTPRGGQYQVILPDGTKVWLNAASSLRYPNRFVGAEKKVELDGEGYFEVVKNVKQKFKVVSGRQEVEVLGTQFNINAYADESQVKTTLVEGSVRLTSLDSKEVARLDPGQQSTFAKGNFEVNKVDVSASIGWKDNDFIFKDQDLRSIMRQLARWYNIEVRYAPDAPLHLKIGGYVSRDNRLSSVLKAMASTNSVEFDFDGKTILVKSAQ